MKVRIITETQKNIIIIYIIRIIILMNLSLVMIKSWELNDQEDLVISFLGNKQLNLKPGLRKSRNEYSIINASKPSITRNC